MAKKKKEELPTCRVCLDEKTNVAFNIRFNAVPICESCASAIFIQQALYYHENPPTPKK
jgi:hypothetical protein